MALPRKLLATTGEVGHRGLFRSPPWENRRGPQNRRVGPSRGYPRLPSSAAVRRITAGAVHLPPRGAGMPLASSSDAIARSEVRPDALMSSTIGRRSVARSAAWALRLSTPTAVPLVRASAVRPLGLPSLVPRALAAASAAFVLALIISRSCSATAARMWMVSRLVVGKSTTTNSTPLSIKLLTKATDTAGEIGLG